MKSTFFFHPGEMSKSSSALKHQLTDLAGKVKTTFDEVGKNEALKKAGEFTEAFGKKAEGAAKAVGSAAESFGKSNAFKVRQVVSSCGKVIEHTPCDHKVVVLNPARYWAFFFEFPFLHLNVKVLNPVSQ